VGVIYAVLIGFVVVTAWAGRDHGIQLTIQEQRSVDDLFHLMGAYPGGEAENIKWSLVDYTGIMVDEWDDMRKEVPLCTDNAAFADPACKPQAYSASQRANELAECIRKNVFELAPRIPRQQVISQEGIRLVQNFSESRDERRLHYKERSLQGILWASFILGALILAGMTYFVMGQDWKSQLIRTTALFAMVGMMVALAIVFDRPLTGSMQIPGDEWHTMLAHFDQDIEADAVPKEVPCGS